jgi:3-phosphoshikimate 1-carboxyvinyltransferase
MTNATPYIQLPAVGSFSGTVTVPGSKSLSNRYLMLAALSGGNTTLKNLLHSDDVQHMLNALQQLGYSLAFDAEQRECTIQSTPPWLNDGALGTPKAKPITLFLGNAGTAMRPLAAALCMRNGAFELTGEPRMYERPIQDLVHALTQLGASIHYLGAPGYPPLLIHGQSSLAQNTHSAPYSITIKGNISSQYLTALLLIAPLCNNGVHITVQGELVSAPYIEITLQCMQKFGVHVEHSNYQSFFIGPQSYRSPAQILVEGDASSASYFLAAAAIKGGPVRVYGFGKNSVQGDAAFAQVLEQMGAHILYHEDYVEVRSGGPLKAIDADLGHITDAAMTIAVTALFAKGTTTIRNIGNWRVKECDRLYAMATELRKVGATVIEGADFISITPPTTWHHAQIHTYNDHRMAMCFSLVSLHTAVTILDPDCTKKTFPNYFEQFLALCT